MSIVPDSKPRLNRDEALNRIKGYIPGTVVVVGIRGYYSKMGPTPGNDRGIYDDAICIIGPEHFSAYNANTDPSAWRPKIASLGLGVHPYRPGNHGISRPGGGYPAFRPATKNEELPVTRDGVAVPWPGVAINIHKGGYNSTSSEGCQTIYPSQWPAFQAALMDQLKRAGQKSFNYHLVPA